jgi:glutathione peroxidase
MRASSVLMTLLFGYPFIPERDEAPVETPSTIYKIPVRPTGSGGGATTLEPWRGKVLLIVNVASRCGFTPQYEELERLYRKYQERGLVVLGFPCNDFLGQEPGSEEEIRQFCQTRYDVTFPIFAKVRLRGKDADPLFAWLTRRDGPCPGRVLWNFEKFLVGRDGRLVTRFRSITRPESARVIEAIEQELAA